MSEPFEREAFTGQLETLTGLRPEQAAAVSDLIEKQIFARLASKDDIAALNARIATLDQQLNEGADIIFKDLAERIVAVPEKTRKAFEKPLREMQRYSYDNISQLKANFWIVLCIAIAVYAARVIMQ
jgi:hypothetical protein